MMSSTGETSIAFPFSSTLDSVVKTPEVEKFPNTPELTTTCQTSASGDVDATDTEPAADVTRSGNLTARTRMLAGDRKMGFAVSAETSGCLRKVKGCQDVVDQLRTVLRDVDIDLPTIVFVGDQSTGKSSVLEAICGVQLPRGDGVVTRCPLQLCLRRTNSNSECKATISVEGTKEPPRHISVDSVWREIEELTKRLAGDSRGIVNREIRLTICGPDLSDLTLIDLPGIARVPVGDQPMEIHDHIRTMYMNYIQSENTLICNVIPADVDIATAESLQWSREVDPTLSRTFIVFTKLDKAEIGLAYKILCSGDQHDSLNLQLGCVAVRCRTKAEVEEGLPFERLLQRERECIDDLISREKSLLPLREEGVYLGLEALAARLVEIQANRVQCIFPKIVQQISEMKESIEDQLYSMPTECITDLDAAEVYFSKIHQLQLIFSDVLSGTKALQDTTTLWPVGFVNSPLQQRLPLLNGLGMQMQNAITMPRTLRGFLDSIFVKTAQRIQMRVETIALSAETTRIIMGAVEAVKGQLAPFHAFEPFKRLVKEALEGWKPEFEADAQAVNEIVRENLIFNIREVFMNMKALTETLNSMAQQMMEKKKKKCLVAIDNCFAEEFQVYTINPAYQSDLRVRQGKRIEMMFAEVQQTACHPRRKKMDTQPYSLSAQMIQNLQDKARAENALDSVRDAFATYLKISAARLCDRIPLIIVRHFCDELIQELYNHLSDRCRMRQYRVYSLLVDDAGLQKRRKGLKIQHAQLVEAERICQDDLSVVFSAREMRAKFGVEGA